MTYRRGPLTRRRGGGRGGAAATTRALLLSLGGFALVAGCARAPLPAPAPEAPPAVAASGPVALDVPGIGVRSSLVPLGLNDGGTVAVPPLSKPMQAGWYSGGPAPGALGPAVILGHVNARGRQGVFARLHELRPGDEIDVRRADGRTAVFTATHVDEVPKAAFPTKAVYGDTDDAELRLITCGGMLDKAHGSYRDNVIVYAVLTATR